MEIHSVRGYQAAVSEASSVQEDQQRRFELDLELPHPDNYLPETVDFPSSPSAMTRNRFGEDLPQELPNNDFAVNLEEDRSFHAVIDHNSVHLRKGNQQGHQQVKVKKRIAVMDDILRGSDDSDTEDVVAPVVQSLAPRNENENGVVDTPSSVKSESLLATQSSDGGWDISPDANQSRDPIENSIAERMPKPDLIPEISAPEEKDEERRWRSVVISGLERKIDLKVIEPYKKVLSHGGYQNNDCQTAVIVFSACYLPDRSRVDYDYVMEHLFLYVLTTLDQLVAEDYNLIYFHGATPKHCIPRFSWVKNCYQMIDRRLRKNLKQLYLVHPTLWLKAAVLMCRPFISAKFSRKIQYVPNLTSLSTLLPMDHVCIPDRVKQYDLLKEKLSNG